MLAHAGGHGRLFHYRPVAFCISCLRCSPALGPCLICAYICTHVNVHGWRGENNSKNAKKINSSAVTFFQRGVEVDGDILQLPFPWRGQSRGIFHTVSLKVPGGTEPQPVQWSSLCWLSPLPYLFPHSLTCDSWAHLPEKLSILKSLFQGLLWGKNIKLKH